MSAYDGKCANCRSKREQQALEKRWQQESRLERVRQEIKAMIEK